MLSVKLDEKNNIAILEPDSALSESDFNSATSILDPIISKKGKLNGLIIHTKDFPGWNSFAAFIAHLKFIKNHHKQISHIALVTDSKMADFAPIIARHFINAQIKQFNFTELKAAKYWITSQK